MKTITIITLLTGVLGFMACGQNNSSSDAIDPEAKGGNTCLLAYADNYGELLTKDMAAEVAGFPVDRAIVARRNAGLETKEYDHVQYEWDNGREKLIKQINRKTNVRDYIQLTGIRAMSLSEFQMSYRAVSDKDIERMENALDDEGKSDVESEAFRKAQKKLDDLGISREQQKDMMKGFVSSAKKITEGYSPVEQLGDAAVWNSKDNRLYILADGAKFEIVAEVSENEAANKAAAIGAAKRILERCY